MINSILSKLSDVRQSGQNKWLARCPAHTDKSPSLSLKDDSGVILMHCFSGCAVSDICAAIGFEVSDLFPQKYTRTRPPQVIRLYTSIVFAGLCDLRSGKGLSRKDTDLLLEAMEQIHRYLESL